MKQKILIVILFIGFLAQVYASSRTWTTTPAEDMEYMVKTFRLLLPLILFVGAPLLLTGAIVVVVKILKHGGLLIYDIIKKEP